MTGAGQDSSFVDVPSMADVMQIDATLVRIEFVKHPIIADSQFELRAAFQSLMRETLQARTHLIHLALNIFTD